MNSDKAAGAVLLATSVLVFGYYTFWVMVTPFIDADHFIQKYFLSKEYAILLPVVLLVLVLSIVGTFISIVVLKSKKTKKAN